MSGKRKIYDDDDGRVIASMNVDGMPWYTGSRRNNERKPDSGSEESDLTKGELRSIIWGTMKAGLLIASVFIVGALLFILFCLYIWF